MSVLGEPDAPHIISRYVVYQHAPRMGPPLVGVIPRRNCLAVQDLNLSSKSTLAARALFGYLLLCGLEWKGHILHVDTYVYLRSVNFIWVKGPYQGDLQTSSTQIASSGSFM